MSLRHSLTSSTCCCRCPVATCSYWERQSRSRGTGRPLDLSQQAEPPRSPRPPPRRVSSCLLKCTGGLDLAVRSGKCGTQRREKAIAAAGAVSLASRDHLVTLSNWPIKITRSFLKLLKLFSSSTSLPTHGLYRKFTSRTMENAHGNTADGVENDLELAGDVVLDRLDADLLEDLGEHDLFLLEGN